MSSPLASAREAADAPPLPVRPHVAPGRIRQDALTERLAFERFGRRASRADRDALFARYLPLATSLATRYRHTSEPFDDLLQVASLGLLKAIERFDPAHGSAFSSFAVPTILGELRRHFRDTTWSVRVPRDLQELSLRLERVSARLRAELQRAPTVGELAEALETTEGRILEARETARSQRASSLQQPTFDDDGGRATMGDLIGRADAGLERVEDAATVQRLMTALDAREREILRLRFEEDLKQSEIGERLGLSQMHVSRLIRQSIARLQLVAGTDPDGDPRLPRTVGFLRSRTLAA